MKVTETIKKEFTPYKISIRVQGNKFVIEYYTRSAFNTIDGLNEHCVHSEKYQTLDEAVKRFNEVIKEIK